MTDEHDPKMAADAGPGAPGAGAADTRAAGAADGSIPAAANGSLLAILDRLTVLLVRSDLTEIEV